MNLLFAFPTWLTIVLLWASLASNIVMLLWISINGNVAKRMENLLTKQGDSLRYNSELAKELLIEMNKLAEVNRTINALNDRQGRTIITLTEQKARYEKIITDNGWELDMSN
jgi:hypothetical protein